MTFWKFCCDKKCWLWFCWQGCYSWSWVILKGYQTFLWERLWWYGGVGWPLVVPYAHLPPPPLRMTPLTLGSAPPPPTIPLFHTPIWGVGLELDIACYDRYQVSGTKIWIKDDTSDLGFHTTITNHSTPLSGSARELVLDVTTCVSVMGYLRITQGLKDDTSDLAFHTNITHLFWVADHKRWLLLLDIIIKLDFELVIWYDLFWCLISSNAKPLVEVSVGHCH